MQIALIQMLMCFHQIHSFGPTKREAVHAEKNKKKEEKLNQPGVKIQKKDQPLQEWKSPPGATSRCRRDTDHRKTHKSKRSNKFDKFHKFPATTHRHNKTRSNLPAQKS